MDLKPFSNKAFSAEYPAGWTVDEREAEFPEGSFPQVRFIGPAEPYEIGVTEKGMGPSFVAPPEVTVTFGPELHSPLKEFSQATYRELKQSKPSKPAATAVGGKEAFEIFCEFTFSEKGIPNPVHIARRILHVNNAGSLVVIAYTAHATQLLRFKAAATAIIESIRFAAAKA